MELPGLCLTDFLIMQELGKGSFGSVYKAKSLKNGGIYVIKKITIDHLSQKNQKEVIYEAQILKKINHPHIVKYYCSFMDGNCLCIVMEYIDGGDLHTLIKLHNEKKLSLPESEIWRMTYELSLAIMYLHTKNIIHRDIKTLNILITKDSKIKLADLGASKIVSAPMQATRVGTPLYLAPEIIKHRPYDYKVDIWALGCVVYNLAALQPPFQAENLITLGMMIVSKNPDPIPSHFSNILSEFISKLLSKQAIDRPNISTVMTLIPKHQEIFLTGSSIENFSTEITVERNSPCAIDDFSEVPWKKYSQASIPIREQAETLPPFISKEIKINEPCFRSDERPSTAQRSRVVFKFESNHRPLSATVKKHPLYHPRDIHILRIAPNCVKLKCTLPRAIKKHITIKDLYF